MIKDSNKPVLFLITGARKQQQATLVIDHIPLIDVINWKDPKTGEVKERKIRYIQGSPSIFADEQGDTYDEKWERERMRPRSLRIFNCMIEVQPTQVNLMKYLKLCNYNASNPSRKTDKSPLIEEFNPEAISRVNNSKRNARIDAESAVRNMDVNQLKAHLVSISSDGTLASIDRFRNMEEEQLRDTAYNHANKDPEGFIASFQAPSTKNKYIIINAVLRQIIIFNEQTNTLTWSNGDVIMTSANGMNAVDALAEISINSPKHQAIIDDLVSRMIDRMTPSEKNSHIPKSNTSLDPYDALIDACIQAKIISFNHPWYVVNPPKGAPDGTKPLKFQMINRMKEGLKADGKKLYIELMERLEQATVTA